jgi:hypothetical protein
MNASIDATTRVSMIDGFMATQFAYNGETKTVYRRGEGPGVVVMHEIPGITPEVAHFARRVADAGFTVAMPDMFGTPGKPLGIPYAAGQMVRACISREFHVLAAHRASPITEWLRALARALYEEVGGRGVGAIGMCLTGNFALALMMDDCLMAPVLSQPSLPFGIGRERRAALHLPAWPGEATLLPACPCLVCASRRIRCARRNASTPCVASLATSSKPSRSIPHLATRTASREPRTASSPPTS